jgi:hypothetical protein
MAVQQGSAALVGVGLFRASAQLVLAASTSFAGVGHLVVDTVQISGNYTPLAGEGFMAADTTQNLVTAASFFGAGQLCVKAYVVFGAPGRTTNRVITGPGPTNNAVL